MIETPQAADADSTGHKPSEPIPVKNIQQRKLMNNNNNEKSPRSGMKYSLTDRILLLSVYAVGLALISLQIRSLL